MTNRNVGLVCSGNTCRSPLLHACIHRALGRDSETVHLWTAGLRVGDFKEAKSGSGEHVNECAEEAARRFFGAKTPQMEILATHRAQSLFERSKPSFLLVWLTECDKVENVDIQCPWSSAPMQRSVVMDQMATNLGAALATVIEADDAYPVFQVFNGNRKAANAETLKENAIDAYMKQLKSLDQRAGLLADRIRTSLAEES